MHAKCMDTTYARVTLAAQPSPICLVDPIPFASASFQYTTAYDFIEHVPRVLATQDSRTRFPFIELMDEIHRVLKPQGLFLPKTPAFPS